jgi:cell division protein FtsB
MGLRNKKSYILKDFIFSKFFLAICIVIFLTIVFGLAKNTLRKNDVQNEITDLQDEIAQLEGQNKEFAQLVQFLNSDTFIEQEAKLKLGYKKPGEQLVVIPLEEVISNQQELGVAAQASNPSKWWYYFFN